MIIRLNEKHPRPDNEYWVIRCDWCWRKSQHISLSKRYKNEGIAETIPAFESCGWNIRDEKIGKRIPGEAAGVHYFSAFCPGCPAPRLDVNAVYEARKAVWKSCHDLAAEIRKVETLPEFWQLRRAVDKLGAAMNVVHNLLSDFIYPPI